MLDDEGSWDEEWDVDGDAELGVGVGVGLEEEDEDGGSVDGCVEELVGVGVEVGVVVEAGTVLVGIATVVGALALVAALDVDAADEDSEFEPPTSKSTKFAVPPEGTVTTQKSPPPAPDAESELVTELSPAEGSILQGRPLQLVPSGHVISIPKVGRVLARALAVKMGFHPIFRKVSPLASVLPPAT